MCAKESTNFKRLTSEEWENAWQQHWKKAQLDYELPINNSEEHKFLSETRTAEKEKERLERITQEFEMGFKKLGK